MKNSITFALVFLLIVFFDYKGLNAKDLSEKNIPIQEQGRIKPLDTYARNQALAFYGKRKIKHEEISAIDWMIDLFIHPEKGLEQKIFNIRSPDIVNALDLEWTNNFHKYSYSEIFPGIQNQLPLISNIFDKKEEDRDLFDNQLVELYQNIMKYRQIASSLSCLLPMFTVYDPETAEKLHIEPGPVSYTHLPLPPIYSV